MSESNNVKFAESNGKWLWKRYDENGSVIHRSVLFDTERQAREDYEVSGAEEQTDNISPSSEVETNSAPAQAPEVATAPSESVDSGNVAPEGEVGVGTAAPDVSQSDADQAA